MDRENKFYGYIMALEKAENPLFGLKTGISTVAPR